MASLLPRLPYSERAPVVLIALTFFLVMSVTYWVTRGQDRSKVGGDGHYHALLALSVAQDGDLDLVDEYRTFGDPYQYGINERGIARAPFSLGPGLAMVPLMKLTLVARGSSDVSHRRLHGSVGKTAAYTAVFLTTGTFLFLFLLLRRSFGKGESALLAIAAIIGLPLFFYTIFHPTYTHAFSALGCTFSVWAAFRWRDHPSFARAATMGVAIGVAGLGRTQYLAVAWFAIAFAVEMLLRPAVRSDRRWALDIVLQLALAGVVSVAVVALQLVLWLPAGHNLRSPIGDHYMHLADPAWWMILFSSRNGLIPWSPLVVLGALGLVRLGKKDPATAIASLLLFGSMWWVNASAWDWHASWGFGARRFASMTVVLALGLGAIWAWAKERRAWLKRATLVILVGFSLMTTGMALNQGQTDGRTDVNMPMLDVYLHGFGGLVAGAGQAHRERREILVGPVRSLLQPIYDRVGNPFSFPMPWILRARDGLDVAAFDAQWGRALLERSFVKPWPARLTYYMSDASVLPVGSGFRRSGTALTTTEPSARALLPFLMRECASLELKVSTSSGTPSSVRLSLDERPLETKLDPRPGGSWLVSRPVLIHRGFNTLEVEHPGGLRVEELAVEVLGPSCSSLPAASM